jgi:hypothetical protein
MFITQFLFVKFMTEFLSNSFLLIKIKNVIINLLMKIAWTTFCQSS